FFIGSHDRAVSYLTEVLEIAHREGNDSYVGQTLVGLSEIALAQGDPESAFAYALEAVNSKGSRQWAQWRALYLRQLANSMFELGRFEEELPILAEALETHRTAGDIHEQSIIYRLMASASRKMNLLEAAQAHIQTSISLAKSSPVENLALALM